jgi:hypothetical protein
MTTTTSQIAPHERLAKDQDPSYEIREIAEELRKTYGIPFWDAILAICRRPIDPSKRIIGV